MRVGAVVVFVALVALARPAHAFEDYEGTRAMGMGGATRGFALGDSAVLLNPSGMSLAKVFNVEAAYSHASRLGANFFHASVVDSTPASNLAGGLYYTYRTDKSAGVSGHGHEAGLALALPLGNFVAVGSTLKWLHLAGLDQGPGLATGGVSFDAGVTLRPTPQLSVGFVGANLWDLHTSQAPQMVSYGVAYLPMPELILALDGVTAFTHDERTGLRGTGVRAGGEWVVGERFGVRLGGGTDALLGVGYVAGGVTAMSQAGALDVGVRGDVWTMDKAASRNLFLGISLRLFVGSASADGSGAPPDMPEAQPSSP